MPKKIRHSINYLLSNANPIWFTIYASAVAFCLYTCVYAFRKTFAVATFEGVEFVGMSYKVWLVTSQVMGYALSKFIGITVVAELKVQWRMIGIFIMVLIAGIAWLLFAFVPAPYNIIFLFMNGLPLGMVWGMVFSYLEGRRMTEVLGAALSVSFIFSAGLCRSVGALTMQFLGTSEYWMPFVTCCLFALPFLFFLLLLDQLPPPSLQDEELRTKRNPMNREERKRFLTTFFPGIVLFVIAYTLLTAFRDFRDNFSSEIWTSLGVVNDPSIYTSTEIPVSIFVLICMGSLMLIKNNKLALMINHAIIIFGLLLIGIANFLFEQLLINASVWMVLIGTGLYLGYVPFNSILFDRLLAAFRYAGTVGFIMYISDSFGYLGSVGVLLFKEFGYANLSWLSFFISGGYVVSLLGSLLIGGSMFYFHRKHRSWLLLNP
ncbi:MAG: hypothetical protein JNM78_10515 [Cyclobacteriaceae bacterium]|nr:hypothetical protein [Cyclobacteriaceae bacterium]